ncbi:794_t:CDS:1 [Acaulospora morrowiae]|uniref:794_t:CDS:1 n=1 Tax=Acaulospora morrowiae TaxID=94023 RepID=A0A9N9G1B7_9GLOM|nr:794_t:CDS:1 [Acaulospora morrowiae]
MVRGNSLSEDLELLINNPQYSDLEIKCKGDVILYGNRAILAARSEIFDRMLFRRTEETFGKQVSFPKIQASVMKVILKYLYTGLMIEKDLTTDNVFETLQAADFFQLENLQDLISEYYKKLCEKKDDESKSPELLSEAVRLMSPLADNGVIRYLVDSVAKISLDSINFNRLSLQGLQCLLLRRDENKMFESSEYSVFRFAVLTAATKVSQEAFSALEKGLPPLNEVEGLLETINNNNLINGEISESIANTMNSFMEHIDLRRINAKIIAKIIEPLDIIPSNMILKLYRFHACTEKPLSAFYGANVKWDKNGCGPGLNISNDGYTVSVSQNTDSHVSVRTNYLMSKGTHEFHVLIEKSCSYAWVGVCDERLDLSTHAGLQQYGWVLGSGGCYRHNSKSSNQKIPNFTWDNVEIIVHLNMDNKTVAFSINGTKYPPNTSWTELPPNLYFVASLKYPGKFRILRYIRNL